jgi:uncharacterized integral membrane protein
MMRVDMRKFLKYLILAPVTLLFLAFAIANRQIVTVSFDPFNSGDIPSPQIPAPLFIVMIAAMMLGVVLGWAATWLRHGRFRKAAREAKAQAEDLRGENAYLRDQVAALKTPSSSTALVPARNAA